MDRGELILEMYRIYIDSKERFIDRSFMTNKFYLVIELVLLFIIGIMSSMQFNSLFVIIFSGLGSMIAMMWWFNQDSYQYLIKVKYRDVIEKLEAEFPIAPSILEFQGIQNDQKRKKAFVFNDAHKLIAFLVLITFFVSFMYYAVPYVIGVFAASLV